MYSISLNMAHTCPSHAAEPLTAYAEAMCLSSAVLLLFQLSSRMWPFSRML